MHGRMKNWLALTLLMGLGVAASFGQGAQADQIKRRARDLSDQNNAQQGVPPPGARPPPPAKPAPAPAPPATPLSPQQKSVAAIRADLGTLATTNSIVARHRFAKTLLAAARGAGKPTGAVVAQVSDDLAAAFVVAKPTPTQLDRLAQNLDGAVNPAGMPKAQTDAIAEDVQSVLQKAGAGAAAAALVANDLKRTVTEAHKAAGR